jgi:hypothetical protein
LLALQPAGAAEAIARRAKAVTRFIATNLEQMRRRQNGKGAFGNVPEEGSGSVRGAARLIVSTLSAGGRQVPGIQALYDLFDAAVVSAVVGSRPCFLRPLPHEHTDFRCEALASARHLTDARRLVRRKTSEPLRQCSGMSPDGFRPQLRGLSWRAGELPSLTQEVCMVAKNVGRFARGAR